MNTLQESRQVTRRVIWARLYEVVPPVVLLVVAALILFGCAANNQKALKSGPTWLVVSIKDQQLSVVHAGDVVAQYRVSTAKEGVGERDGAGTTPRGMHAVAEKIGQGVDSGIVFVDRIPTGEYVAVDTPGRWPVVSRIIRLKGLESFNRNTFERLIYIHGSPVEKLLGSPASGGCIRLRSADVIELFEMIDINSLVYISESSMAVAISESAPIAISSSGRAE
jgi:lipoprotein-anchoring transpeptidase ErfK/SrfK